MFSLQTQQLYQILLNSNKSLSAKRLSTQLGFYPNVIYRLAKPLVDIGIVEKVGKNPLRFKTKPIDESLSLFLLWQNNWFSKKFSNHQQASVQNSLSLSFVQGRDELMNVSVGEVNKAKKSIDLLRSGHEIPADLMLALNKAKQRGLVTRMLIQDYEPENINQIKYWQKNGILVKKSNLKHLRIMIYDSSVVYFMSYKHNDSQKDQGMKICYPPLATIFTKLFDEWWDEAEKI